ncbi:RNA polymerase subunit sigma-70 [Rathayibacter caricis DSM 15933]|uniref:RNA polymerase subunit sigma-70 n=1 Tax=Rathayibacter caricis DSM 15933 TaxID=1328867 RepID=A0A2T4UPK1_9MICO|nr:sigma-70 family RNA polymerase sigma factor [Rathayibacter caricis]PTL71458.1 RNA polymerase subunit sigma-70 [Rathayibacter caricis DSM 15933]
MEWTAVFEAERGRLTGLATRLLGDRHEAEDTVQLAWLRLHGTDAVLENPAAWLTTVTTRLCLDRLRARIPEPVEAVADAPASGADPAESAERRDEVGRALHVVVDRLSPNERVALVLHESFGYSFDAIGGILDRSPAAARKLASRAREKVASAEQDGPASNRSVVDAFMAAARGGDLAGLLALLAPGATVRADAAAIAAGTPERIDGREAVAAFFDGSAHAALPVLTAGRPGFAWFHLGEARVLFDFAVRDGRVESIVFRAAPEALAGVVRRPRDTPAVTSEGPRPS